MRSKCSPSHLLPPTIYRPRPRSCVQQLEEFTIEGRGSSGSHLCFAMSLYSGNVQSLIGSFTQLHLPLLAKRITLHLLRGVAFPHERRIVHTDTKPDNVLFTTLATAANIDKWVEEDLSRRNPSKTPNDGVVQSVMSQPMKLPTAEDTLKATYVLSDFGCGRYSPRPDGGRLGISFKINARHRINAGEKSSIFTTQNRPPARSTG